MRIPKRAFGLVTASLLAAGALVMNGGPTAAQSGPVFTPGAEGAGDAYFPFAGNGGYDVEHYDLDITYTPPAPAPAPLDGPARRGRDHRPRGHAGPGPLQPRPARAWTCRRSRSTASGPARSRRPHQAPRSRAAAYWQVQDDAARVWELTIQPRPKIKEGQSARVVVTYGGDTTRPADIEGVLYGWVTTRDGAMVVGEPEGSMTWYPVSDHQTDKATYSFEITVPEGKVAVANGLPAGDPVTRNGWTTWFWDAPDAQASYLTTASVGDYDLRVSETAGGLPIIDAVDDALTPTNAATTEASLALQADMIAFIEGAFVPYPFNSYGCDRRRRHGRLRARDADPARCTPGSPARARWSTSWPTSGSATP